MKYLEYSKKNRKFALLLLGLFPLLGAAQNISPKREFRGVWVATVANIDWPSKSTLTVAQQKQELIQLLDKHQKQGINAVFFQVRPAADALYAKSQEPWSQWLTGNQGTAPFPYYDPLEFMINECHKRGMELHAWFNPYRAIFDNTKSSVTSSHITKMKPEWFFSYGGKTLFNPGIPEVREYITQVILNVVDQYDIDGIHFDDYFYPYAVKGETLKDIETFILYNQGINNIDDWRRDNVDRLIKMIDDSVHAHKKYVKFGVSPFGIWKNKAQDAEGSETAGGNSYYELYADSRKWVREGWVDYINPQIYWSFTTRAAPYAKLVDWWSNHTYGRHLYIGQGAYRINDPKDLSWRNPGQIGEQIVYNRKNTRVQGSVFFSSKSLNNNLLGVSDTLARHYFKYPALPPAMLWLDSIAPHPPQNLLAVSTNNSILLSWKEPLRQSDEEAPYGYVVYRFSNNDSLNLDSAAAIKKIYYQNITSWEDFDVQKGEKYTYIVTAIDRLKNESEQSIAVSTEFGKEWSNR